MIDNQVTPPPSVVTSKRQRELVTYLNYFYEKPVARVSLEVFLTVFLVLFLASFAIRPTLITMSDLIKEIENKRELDGQLLQKIAALQTAQTEYAFVANNVPLLDEAIPTEANLIKSIKIIEKAASDNSVIIEAIGTEEIPEKSDPTIPFNQRTRQFVIIQVGVSGDYQSIRNFIETLKGSRRAFTIETINFSLEENRGNKKLDARINISLPYFGVTSNLNKESNKAKTTNKK